MVSRLTLGKLARMLAGLSAHEREMETIRTVLKNANTFDSYAAFRLLDRRGVGYVTSQDFTEFMQLNHVNMTSLEAHLMVRRLDVNKDGKVTYEDFLERLVGTISGDHGKEKARNGTEGRVESGLLRLVTCELEYIRLAQRNKEDLFQSHDFSMQSVFQEIAAGDKSRITATRLTSFLTRLGVSSDQQDVKRIYNVMDRDKDGEVNYTDFLEAIMLIYEDFPLPPRVSSAALRYTDKSTLRLSTELVPTSDTLRTRSEPRIHRTNANEETLRIPKELTVRKPILGFGDFLRLQIDGIRSLETIKQNLILQSGFHPLVCFRMFDSRNEGFLTASSFSAGLEALGLSIPLQDALHLLKRFSRATPGHLSPSELSALLLPRKRNFSIMLPARDPQASSFTYETRNALTALFERYFDIEKLVENAQNRLEEETYKGGLSDLFSALSRGKTGFLTESDLRTALELAGVEADPDEMSSLMKLYDPDDTGKVRFNMFVQAVVPGRKPRVV